MVVGETTVVTVEATVMTEPSALMEATPAGIPVVAMEVLMEALPGAAVEPVTLRPFSALVEPARPAMEVRTAAAIAMEPTLVTGVATAETTVSALPEVPFATGIIPMEVAVRVAMEVAPGPATEPLAGTAAREAAPPALVLAA